MMLQAFIGTRSK